MADVTFDAASSSTPATATTHTHAHTCTGIDRLLLVGVFIGSSNDWVTGVTYNTIAMTRLYLRTNFAGATTYGYALQAPATGANNIVVTCSNSVLTAVAAYSVINAKQTVTMDVLFNGFTGANATRLWGPTTTVTDRALVMLFGWNDTEVPADSTNFTARSVVNRQMFCGEATSGIKTPPGAVYLQQTTSVATNWLTGTIGIAPVPAAGGSGGVLGGHQRRMHV